MAIRTDEMIKSKETVNHRIERSTESEVEDRMVPESKELRRKFLEF